MIITFLSLSLVIYNISSLLNLAGVEKVRCHDSVNMAMPGNNHSPLCKAQASFVFYGILCAVLWYFVLVLNVYENVVFMTTKLSRVKWIFFPLCFLPPLAPLIALHAMDNSGYTFGTSCTSELGSFMNAALLIPIACVIFPSIALNLHILLRIFWVARRRNASINNILRLQLRLFSFALYVLTVFLFYWSYYMARLQKLSFDPTALWLRNWFFCVLEGSGQNGCTSHAEGHVPELGGFTIADFLVCSVGFVVMCFFGLRVEVFHFWRDVLSGDFGRIKEPSSKRMIRQNTGSASNTSKVPTQHKEEVEM